MGENVLTLECINVKSIDYNEAMAEAIESGILHRWSEKARSVPRVLVRESKLGPRLPYCYRPNILGVSFRHASAAFFYEFL